MAKLLAHTTGLRERIESGELSTQDVLGRARTLWHDMQRKEERGLEEIELATALAAVAENAADEVSNILVDVSLADRQPVTWVSALARRLYQDRPDYTEILHETQGAVEVNERAVDVGSRRHSSTKNLRIKNGSNYGVGYSFIHNNNHSNAKNSQLLQVE